MLIIVIFILLLAGLLGYQLLNYLLKNKHVPKAFAISHGTLALLGLGLLIFYHFTQPKSLIFPIVIFIIVAAGGMFLAKRDFTAKPIPKWLAITHAAGAILGFILLLYLL